MDKFKNDPRICHVYVNHRQCNEPLSDYFTTIRYDYGVAPDYYIIVMKLYKDSLKGWRKKQKGEWYENLPLYLNLYEKVLETMKFLTENNILYCCFIVWCCFKNLLFLLNPVLHVNHYDIKCDNFLLSPIDPNTTDDDFYEQPSDVPNFMISLAGTLSHVILSWTSNLLQTSVRRSTMTIQKMATHNETEALSSSRAQKCWVWHMLRRSKRTSMIAERRYHITVGFLGGGLTANHLRLERIVQVTSGQSAACSSSCSLASSCSMTIGSGSSCALPRRLRYEVSISTVWN